MTYFFLLLQAVWFSEYSFARSIHLLQIWTGQLILITINNVYLNILKLFLLVNLYSSKNMFCKTKRVKLLRMSTLYVILEQSRFRYDLKDLLGPKTSLPFYWHLTRTVNWSIWIKRPSIACSCTALCILDYINSTCF